MKRTLLASAAAVLVSSALFAAPASAAAAPTSGSVLPASFQPAPKASTGGMSTMGAGNGASTFWCVTFGFFC
ncbi:hypothetical protein AB0333_06380 [Citricoccus sp. NPDC079358]|uniref:hypothetical protein n=1 Tax=Citricoccus sp. NPDC079358 TaxID=3154653 RepID=UPI00344C5A0A